MKKEKMKKLDTFLQDMEKTEEKDQVVIREKDGLIEKMDKTYITRDGKQLLKD